MPTYIQPILEWLHLHPHWASVAAFGVCFVECMVIFGLLTPGVIFMSGIGALVGSGIVPFWEIMLSAILGAVCGDILSYWLGMHYHAHIREIWPFKRYPTLFAAGQTFFEKHGGKSVFFGKFAGPLRAITPVTAGILHMHPVRFIIVSLLSSIIWVPIYMFPGFIIGAAAQELSPQATTHLFVLIIGILLLLWLTSSLIRHLLVWKLRLLDVGFGHLWQYIKKKPNLKWLQNWLVDADSPDSTRPLILFTASIVCMILFLVLALNVYYQGYFTHLNWPVYYLFRGIRNPLGDEILLIVTMIAEPKLMFGIILLIGVYLLFKRRFNAALCWLGCNFSSIAIASLIRNIIHSARPIGLTLSPTGWSFPSGHSLLSVSIFGFLAVILARELPTKYRSYIFTTAVSLILLVVLSRLYLGAHWLTDTLGGVLLSLSSLTFFTQVYYRKPSKKVPTQQLLYVVSFLFIISVSYYAFTHYSRLQYNYTPQSQPMHLMSKSDWWEQTNSLPLHYSTTRVGQPAHWLNVQWSSQLSDIRQMLSNKGWIDLTHPKFIIFLKNVILSTPQPSPVFAQLYNDQAPSLIMGKPLGNGEYLLLHLWPANTLLITKQGSLDTQLWIGSIGFANLKKNHKNGSDVSEVKSTQLLEKDLSQLKTKHIPYPSIKPLNRNNARSWSGYIILIEPK